MKFNFIFGRRGLLAALALAAGCTRPTTAGGPRPAGDAEAQRLVALLDYVAGDYGLAVRDGQVVSPAEYREQVAFLGSARERGERLATSVAGGTGTLRARIEEAEVLVRARAGAVDVARACREARDEAVLLFGLRTGPSTRPSLARAEALYAESCAACHGLDGGADTGRARTLEPPPASFRDPGRLAGLSPHRVYNALTFGVTGTAMASFDALPPEDRWSLAFYVFRLGHEGRPARGPLGLPLADQAGRTDDEIRAALRAEGHGDPEGGLTFVRREAAFQESPAGLGLDLTRRMVRQAAAFGREGRREEAEGMALDAYLRGFEPLEARLVAREPARTGEAEAEFHRLRASLAAGDQRAAAAHAARVETLLVRLGRSERPVLPFVGALLVYLREGAEAALLVGLFLGVLRRLGRADAGRWVHAGWLLALPAGVATWWLLGHVLRLAPERRELAEAAVALVAAAVLFCVSFWMISKVESRRWTAYLEARLEKSLSSSNLLMLAGLSFLAVYREAAETVLFTRALLLEAAGHEPEVWAGAAAGLGVVAAAAATLRRAVLGLPLGLFFGVSGALLCVLAVSFAGAGLFGLVGSGYLRPRPVRFPEVPWMGIHADLTSLAAQLAIVTLVAAAGVLSLRKPPTTQ
jgi:high-affinity iron transporter